MPGLVERDGRNSARALRPAAGRNEQSMVLADTHGDPTGPVYSVLKN